MTEHETRPFNPSAGDDGYRYKICCLGAGYVGGPTMATVAANCPDIKVFVCDLNQKRVDAWNSDKLPIYEPGLEEVVAKSVGKNLVFTTDVETAINECEMIFVAVNTPTKYYGMGAGRASNLKNWELAARSIAKIATSPKIIIEKSTLPVRTAASMKIVLEANSFGTKYEILSNPEFLAEGTAITDLQTPDRVLIGGDETKSGSKAIEKLAWVYRHWVAADRILTTNLWSSELSKLVANAFLAQRVSSINSISALCEMTGAQVTEVSKAIGMDARIGNRFLNASVGFGGSCFQKDILNLVYLCESYGLSECAAYWNQVVIMNDWQKRRFAKNIVKSLFNTITGKSITLFGFAFKANTGDTRESPAIFVAGYLLNERAKLRIYDPQVGESQVKSDLEEYKAIPTSTEFKELVTVTEDPYLACQGSHAIAIMTEWKEFQNYDYKKIYDSMEKPAFIFDGRNIVDHKALRDIGFQVYNIGSQSHRGFIDPYTI